MKSNAIPNFQQGKTHIDTDVHPINLAGDELRVLTIESLTKDSFRRLVDGDVPALRVPGYYDGASANRLGNWINRYTTRKLMEQMLAYPDKQHASRKDVYREARVCIRPTGTTREVLEREKRENQTFNCGAESAIVDNKSLRKFAGNNDPSVRLLSSLRAACPPGACFLAPEGIEMVYGAGGIVYPPLRGATPHIDLPFSFRQTQFSAIVYLRLPPDGGELKIWPQKEVYFLTKEKQDSCPTVLIKPDKGDLILFDTTRLHAVMGFAKGFRISARMLIGYEPDKPLEIYN